MSVVDGDWEDLKRYNLAELYTATPKQAPAAEGKTVRESAKKGEASTTASTSTDSAEPK
jgi:hypothetical protein